jgi:hypothetical protein
MIANSTKLVQRNLFMVQPRVEMRERALPLTLAAACATDAKNM